MYKSITAACRFESGKLLGQGLADGRSSGPLDVGENTRNISHTGFRYGCGWQLFSG